MKQFQKVLFYCLSVIFLIACVEQTDPDVVIKNDDYKLMMKETEQRDSAMIELVKTLNLIDDNIEKITERKKELQLQTNDVENRQSYRDRILDEIQEIYVMMQQNREKIDQLNERLADSRNKLSKSNADLKHANELIAQYQVMIDNMTEKLERKDEEIYLLKEELAQIDISLDSLKVEYSQQHKEMNVVYYAYGSKKELLYHNIIDKKGGFIGIGKSFQLKSDFNKDYFTKADAEELASIDLFVKEAELLSTHREGSYHFEGDGKVDALIIDDASAFWEASKFLVIQVGQK